MSKLWLKHQKFMKGNAGFSLVELIIVIAIMAALIAILAPQNIKYVEKSRNSADQTQLDEVLSAVKVAAADPDYAVWTGTVSLTYNTTTKVYDITATVASGVTDSSPTFQARVISALGTSSFSLKSTAGLGTTTYTITVATDSIKYTAPTTWPW